ncbi:NAD(P)-binding protein [Cylindrobasidium torrendii FP15055 ss-10]|uniref:NAD(P)-binding protein n=1 Tax=Cylindrobasidium torrendii FP15055 ss-10 TaxID=1314674 RepID=A0A0D7BWW2_9AGAR|nr:NAD(P)-binding protein [Cylindrobasidium torrendii FP15055 ss-10]
MFANPVVFIAGATGYTGSAIARGLLSGGTFARSLLSNTVIILVRSSSCSKPIVKTLEAAGAVVRLGDVTDRPEQLEQNLEGVDILISTVFSLDNLKPLFLAASKLGVKRVIPSDFGPHAPRGVMFVNDLKLDLRNYIKSLGLPYTFVEVGWWTKVSFPYPHAIPESWIAPKHFVGTCDVPSIQSTLGSIAAFMERIIVDERTLNQVVLIHDGEYTLNEMRGLGEKISGEDFSDYPVISPEKLQSEMVSEDPFVKSHAQYKYSMYIRGDNTLANAKADGLLIARELYDGIPVPDLEEEGRKFYKEPFVWGQSEV